MRKRTYLIPTLSALLFSSTVLSHTVRADEAATVYPYENITEQSNQTNKGDDFLESTQETPSNQQEDSQASTDSEEDQQGVQADQTSDQTKVAEISDTQTDQATDTTSDGILDVSESSSDTETRPTLISDGSAGWSTGQAEIDQAQDLESAVPLSQDFSIAHPEQGDVSDELETSLGEPIVTVGSHELDYGLYQMKRKHDRFNSSIFDLDGEQEDTAHVEPMPVADLSADSGQVIFDLNQYWTDSAQQHAVTDLKGFDFPDYLGESSPLETVDDGASPYFLDGDPSSIQSRETNLGNLITDAMLAYSQTGFTHQSDFAVIDGGAIKASINKGQQLTAETLDAVLPEDYRLVQIPITGQEIFDLFNKSLSAPLKRDEDGSVVTDEDGVAVLEPQENFLQVSGVNVQYNVSQDITDYTKSRVLTIAIQKDDQLDGLELDKTYYMTTTERVVDDSADFAQLTGTPEYGTWLKPIVGDFLSTVTDWTDYEYSDPYNRIVDASILGVGGFNQILMLEDSKALNVVPQTIAFLTFSDLDPIDISEQTAPVPTQTQPNNPIDQTPDVSDGSQSSQNQEDTQPEEEADSDNSSRTLEEALKEAIGRDEDQALAETIRANADEQADTPFALANTLTDSAAESDASAGGQASATGTSGGPAGGAGVSVPANGAMLSPRPVAPKSYANEALVSFIGIVTVAAGALFDHLRLRRPK